MTDTPHLRRTIGLWQMTFYGMGSMLGAGIYGLIGVAAGEMGSAVWLAFLVSLVAALLTGLSYASLGSRYPRAAGSAYVIQRAYKYKLLTHVAGLAICASGITSMAAGARVIGGNFQRLGLFESTPLTVFAIVYLAVLALIVYRGIRESMWVNVVCTIVEAGGLLLVIAVGISYWGSANLLETPSGTGLSAIPIALLMQGAALTFYSFIGFEDTVNVAEEVKDAERVLPLGIVLGMSLTFLIYLCVAITAVSVVPWRELAATSGTPLLEVVTRAAPWFPTWIFIIITIFSVANTGLINYVTASRLLYGMSRDGQLPHHLSILHKERRTPHIAVAIIFAILVALALFGDISQLASATVLLLLAVFSVVNVALVILKLRKDEPKGAFEIPLFVPALGSVVCLALLIARSTSGDWRAPAIAGIFIVAALALYTGIRKRT